MFPSAGFTCSGEDGNHVFGECRVAARLLASVPVPGVGSIVVHILGVGGFCSYSWWHDIKRAIGTATHLHGIERDDYINKAPCRVLPALPLGMPISFSKLQSL